LIKKAILSLIVTSSLFAYKFGLPEEYYKIKDMNKKKEYFINFINNLATAEIQIVHNQRKFIKKYYLKKDTDDKTSINYKKYLQLSELYKLNIDDSLEKYLKRIDIIPNSLVISQAIIESGWGKSRFARYGNNLFGQWTWKFKGFIPKRRAKNSKHKVRIFDTMGESVHIYIKNLNTNRAYKKLRQIRYSLRKKEKIISGRQLSKGLTKYSQLKGKYMLLLGKIISKNNLKRYDRKYD
jgi:Bax protein